MSEFSSLASPSATRAVLERHGLATKKALGQNFLVNDSIIGKICALSEVGPDDSVLEVGPGIGTLTVALCACAGHVVSVERDTDLPQVLAETCAPFDNFRLISKDALALTAEDLASAESDLPSAVCSQDHAGAPERAEGSACVEGAACPEREDSAAEPFPMPDKFIANLPYAVAATLVLDYFQRFDSIQSATVMVQKEVADRMMAAKGTKDYGAYTVKLNMIARPAGRFPVSPNNFFPPPRVDSAVIRLERRDLVEEGVTPVLMQAACMAADAAFASRRKTISNSMKTYFAGRGAGGAFLSEHVPDILERAGTDPGRRGESLDLDEFVALGKALLETK